MSDEKNSDDSELEPGIMAQLVELVRGALDDPVVSDVPDDSEPTPERVAELRAAYDANVAAGKAPYEGVAIATLGELSWVMRERDWSGEYDAGGKARATLSGADLSGANLSRADLGWATLSGAYFTGANLSGAYLSGATLSGADLREALMEAGTKVTGATLDSRSLLADVVWDGVPVTRLNWEDVDTLGDEWVAHQAKDEDGKPKDDYTRLQDFQDAVLANRQVATLLRSQGLNEHADRFAYRAQVLQRQVLRRQREPLRALFSGFLDLLAGYGFKPERSLAAYLLAILGFGTAYYALGQSVGPHLSPLGAFVFSMTSFHGRGFFPGGIALDDPLTVLAAFEAFVGLVIEVSFIATFTQRFFAR